MTHAADQRRGPWHLRADSTITRTTTWPTPRGPITETITRSTSRPTVLQSSDTIVVDVDDFDSDEDLNLDEPSEPPSSPSPRSSTPPRTIIKVRSRPPPPPPPRTPQASPSAGPTAHAPASPGSSSRPIIISIPLSASHMVRVPETAISPATSAPYKVRQQPRRFVPRPPQLIRIELLGRRSRLSASAVPAFGITGGSVIREYLPPHPDTLVKPTFSSRAWFTLCSGLASGIYPYW